MLSTIDKIFCAIFLGRIAPYPQNIIGPYQRGFTPSKSATDQIFPVQQVMENYWNMAFSCIIFSSTLRLYNDEIYERYHDRLVLDKIWFNRLRWEGPLIRIDEDDPRGG